VDELGNNLKRLLGLHDLTARQASMNLHITQQAISELQSGKRTSPRYRTIHSIGEFFEIPSDRLTVTPFADLLAAELSDAERYRRVEAKIKRSPPVKKVKPAGKGK
jgi:transcriptional regulator with XRE-family HTH domain